MGMVKRNEVYYEKLPKHMIGGYYERAELLAYVANIIEDDDLILIKGSVRNSNFKM